MTDEPKPIISGAGTPDNRQIYRVEFTTTVDVLAHDSVEAVEMATELAKETPQYIYVDGDFWG